MTNLRNQTTIDKDVIGNAINF